MHSFVNIVDSSSQRNSRLIAIEMAMFHVCCHEGTAITFARDRRVYLMNAERQSQSASAADPPIGSYSVYIHHRHLLLLGSKADTHFTVPRRLEG